jgi:fatty acid desaturase
MELSTQPILEPLLAFLASTGPFMRTPLSTRLLLAVLLARGFLVWNAVLFLMIVALLQRLGGDLDITPTILATPEAVLVGAAATLLVLLLAAAVGLFLRYVPVLISGLLILVLVAVVWYLSSKYPGAARRLGARIWEALRSGASTVVDRLLGRHHPEVSEN